MYRYDEFDHAFVKERTAQFRAQVEKRLAGNLTEEEFKPLRLMNGLYLQLHAYMLRVAIPYGAFDSRQMRQLAMIAERYDRGYGHMTTRQNIQFNWPKLKDVPDILDALAAVEMHAIQTSGNCIRNVTADPFAGAAADEIEDPRPTAELLRQWSSLHPEFTFLPRKFKIAVTGAEEDRAAIKLHDIGIQIVRNEAGETGYRMFLGGGQGRTPMIAACMKDFLPKSQLLAWVEAAMRVYNALGRRDNKYKARVKIMVHELGAETVEAMIAQEFEKVLAEAGADAIRLDEAERLRIERYFAPPALPPRPVDSASFKEAIANDPAFASWVRTNTHAHKIEGYRLATLSLKPIGGIPGDVTADQMRAVADMADQFSLGFVRATHEQSLVLPHVAEEDLPALYRALLPHDLATANRRLISDIIACPGQDYCALATARSIPVAQKISERFADQGRQEQIGDLPIKISGCINACGHHHVGAIGILGLERGGKETYQITLGGDASIDAAIGKITGRGFDYDETPGAVETIVDTYLAERAEGEDFLATYRRVGMTPFKEALYG